MYTIYILSNYEHECNRYSYICDTHLQVLLMMSLLRIVNTLYISRKSHVLDL